MARRADVLTVVSTHLIAVHVFPCRLVLTRIAFSQLNCVICVFDSRQLHQEDAGQSQRLWSVSFSPAVADYLPAKSIVRGALDKVVLVNCRVAIGLLAALAVVLAVPAQGHADPPTKCLSNTPTGKQVYVPCDLLNAGVNFPPGQRCPLPLEQYPKEVAS